MMGGESCHNGKNVIMELWREGRVEGVTKMSRLENDASLMVIYNVRRGSNSRKGSMRGEE